MDVANNTNVQMQYGHYLYWNFSHILIIDKCINDLFHGRIKIYGINGYNKTYLKQNMCIIGTEESNNESVRMNSP